MNDEHHDHDAGHDADLHDVTLSEWIAWAPILVAIVVFGILPKLMFDVFDPAVTALVDRLGESLNP